MKTKYSAMVIAAIGFAAMAQTASAAVTINATEVGADVILNITGSVNTTGLSLENTNVGGGNFVLPATGGLVFNPYIDPSYSFSLYSGITGPTSFGINSDLLEPFRLIGSSGSVIGFVGREGFIILANDYVSASLLSGSVTVPGVTIENLNMQKGTYTWNWGSGSNADSLTLSIGAAPVPEPETYAMFLAGLGVLGGGSARRKYKDKAAKTA